MATSSNNRAFQAYNSHNFKNHPSIKSNPISTVKEPLVFGRIPYSSIKPTIETSTSTPSSPNPNNVVKPIPLTPKRRSSVTSLGNILPRRKSLQMTALASQRQSLWMSIAKNAAQTNTTNQTSSFPLRSQPQSSLLRKKFLRLLLVFSYLLSISLFAIALATFYGFFWSGYSTTQTPTEISNVLLTTNTSIRNIDLSVEEVSLITKKVRRAKNNIRLRLVFFFFSYDLVIKNKCDKYYASFNAFINVDSSSVQYIYI